MRKILSILLTLCLIIGLTACSGRSSEEAADTDNGSEASETEQTDEAESNDISAGKCSAGNINVSPNAVETENVSGLTSSSAASAKDKSTSQKDKKTKDKSSKNSGSGDDDDSDDPDKPALDDLGEINDVEENPGSNALLYFILIGIGVLILTLTVIQIIKKLRAGKSNKTNKN